MAEKHTGVDPRYLDRRVVERYMRKGLLDEKEYQRLLKALPDLAEKSSKVDTAFEPAGELGPSR
jgi:hypothetical protein